MISGTLVVIGTYLVKMWLFPWNLAASEWVISHRQVVKTSLSSGCCYNKTLSIRRASPDMTRDADGGFCNWDGWTVFVFCLLWTPAATNFVFHYPHADIIGHVLRYISYCIYVQLSFFRDYNEEKDAEGHLWLLYSKGSELFQWDAIFRRFSLLLSCKIFCFLLIF